MDIETTNAFNFPKGALCSIAAAHELNNFELVYTLINPAPFIDPVITLFPTPYTWDNRCVQLHHISPTNVQLAPSLADTLHALFQWASLDYTIPEVLFYFCIYIYMFFYDLLLLN